MLKAGSVISSAFTACPFIAGNSLFAVNSKSLPLSCTVFSYSSLEVKVYCCASVGTLIPAVDLLVLITKSVIPPMSEEL